jgi:hypothetical protein
MVDEQARASEVVDARPRTLVSPTSDEDGWAWDSCDRESTGHRVAAAVTAALREWLSNGDRLELAAALGAIVERLRK